MARRREPKMRRAPLTRVHRHKLETGEMPKVDPQSPEYEDRMPAILAESREPGRAWEEHRADILSAWVEMNPGTRPYAWWKLEAPAPRRVVEGHEHVLPVEKPGDWEWAWRQDFGIPAFAGGPIVVEAQAEYLRRNHFLTRSERRDLPKSAFKPEQIEP